MHVATMQKRGEEAEQRWHGLVFREAVAGRGRQQVQLVVERAESSGEAAWRSS